MKKVIMIFILIVMIKNIYAQDNDSPIISEKEVQTGNAPFEQSKFVPNISLIADFIYLYRNFNNEKYEEYDIPGFLHSPHDNEKLSEQHHSAYSKKGFNLNYCELVLDAAVDPYFTLYSNFHITESALEIEELYGETTRLPFDLKVKGGKFLSGFGRLNAQHAHVQDFAEVPIVYSALLGDHGLAEKGVQVSWLAPLDFYLLIGFEMLQGENETSYGSEGFTINQDNTDIVLFAVPDSEHPDLKTGFIRISLDSENFIVMTGLSGARGRSRIDHGVNEDPDDGHAVYADTGIFGIDYTMKYLFDSYRYISFQTEYLYRKMKGSRYTYSGIKSDLEKEQSGMYAQLVVKPFLLWRFGARFDLLHRNKVATGGEDIDFHPQNSTRYSGMTELNLTEFSRLRVQYNQDRTRYNAGKRKIVHEVIFQCNLAIGAHGAHEF